MIAPTAASHTYKLQLRRSTGTGTLSIVPSTVTQGAGSTVETVTFSGTTGGSVRVVWSVARNTWMLMNAINIS